MQKQHRVGALDFIPGAFDADFFNLAFCFAQTGGIDHMQRHAVDLDQLRHLVPGRAGDRRDDRQLRAGQRIEQRTFSHIRLTGDHHLNAFAQDRPLRSARHYARQARLQPLQLTPGIGLFQKINVFLGKIQRCLDQHAQMDQLLKQRLDRLRQLPRHGTRR